MSDETFRPHIPPHRRSISEQTLDALLRIEEQIKAVLAINETKLGTQAGATQEPVGSPKQDAEPAPKKGGVLGRRR